MHRLKISQTVHKTKTKTKKKNTTKNLCKLNRKSKSMKFYIFIRIKDFKGAFGRFMNYAVKITVRKRCNIPKHKFNIREVL